VPLLVGGWLWVGRSGQQAPADDVMESTNVPADADRSAGEEPIAKAKPKRRLQPGKKPVKPSDEPSGPSPLDGLDTLTPTPSGK